MKKAKYYGSIDVDDSHFNVALIKTTGEELLHFKCSSYEDDVTLSGVEVLSTLKFQCINYNYIPLSPFWAFKTSHP